MNYSTKHCFVAEIAKSSHWYCKDALHRPRDTLTFICLCHCFLAECVPFEDQGCFASPESHHPKATASSQPAAQHHQGKAGRKILSPWEQRRRCRLKHLGWLALGSCTSASVLCPLPARIQDHRLIFCPSNSC